MITIENIYVMYWDKMLHQVCKKYTKNIEDAEDLCQNGFLKIKDNLHKYKETGSLEGWIRRLLRNYIIDTQRKKTLNVVEEVNWDIIDNSMVIEDSPINKYGFTIEDVLNVRNKLPKRKLEVFNLVLDGYKHKEIAVKLNITEGHSKATYHRTKISLRKLLLNGKK